jgi:hypothetical protein
MQVSGLASHVHPSFGPYGTHSGCGRLASQWRRRRVLGWRRGELKVGEGGDDRRLVAAWRRALWAHLGPAGPCWDLCAYERALWARGARLDPIGTGVPCCCLGVKVVLSRVAAVILTPIQSSFRFFRACLVAVASVRRRWRLRDHSGTCWWASSLV